MPLVGFHLGRIGAQDQRAFLRETKGSALTQTAIFGCHGSVKKESLLNQGDSPMMQIRHVLVQKK
jgi:hypothetical protein